MKNGTSKNKKRPLFNSSAPRSEKNVEMKIEAIAKNHLFAINNQRKRDGSGRDNFRERYPGIQAPLL